MKKRMLFTIIIITSMLIADLNVIQAQDNETNYGRFGIGVSFLSLMNFVSFEGDFNIASSVYLPITTSEGFRLEPEVGFFESDNDFMFSLGFGIFGLKKHNHLITYYGARIGTWNMENFHISPTVGGEYLLSDNFSIGAEAQIKAVLGDVDLAIFTNTAAFLRFYFK